MSNSNAITPVIPTEMMAGGAITGMGIGSVDGASLFNNSNRAATTEIYHPMSNEGQILAANTRKS